MVTENTVLNRLLIALQQFWQSTLHWRRRSSYFFHAIALICVSWAIWQSLFALEWRNMEINYQLIVIAQTSVFAVVLLGAINWWFVTLVFRFNGSWLWHIRTHLVSNVSKYLPGSIWVYLSKASLSVQTGTPKRQVMGAMIMEMLLALTSGAMLVFFTGWWAVDRLLIPIDLHRSAWLGLGGLMLFVIYFAYRIIGRWSVPRNHRESRSGIKEASWLFAAVLVLSMGWLFLAVSLSWFADAFYVREGIQLSVYIFALCVSIVFGILSIFVPNGIGVREGLLVLLLRDVIPVPVAVLIALALRISIMLAELSTFILVLGMVFVTTRRNNPIGVLKNGIRHDKFYTEVEH